MSFADLLTPPDTTEMKPGFFVKKTRTGYRQINPFAWKGKIRWGPQLGTVFSFHTLIWFLILGAVVYGYFEVNEDLLEFRELVVSNPIGFCNDLFLSLQTPGCTPEYDRFGLCFTNLGIDQTTIEMINESFNSIP